MNYLVQPHCSSCTLNCGKQVYGSGDIDSPDLMIIGDYPGTKEHYSGQIFIGDAGNLIRQTIGQIKEKENLPNLTVYYSNTVQCRTPDGRAPLLNEIANCYGRLVSEIEVIKPKAILLLGLVAANTLLKAKTLTSVRGKTLDFKGIPITATFHPNYLIGKHGNPNQFRTFVSDIYSALGINDEVPRDWNKPRQFTLIESKEALQCLFHYLRNSNETSSIDLETFHVDPRQGFILWVGIRHEGINYIIPEKWFKLCVDEFPSEHRFTVHRAYMEWPWLKHHYGIELNNIDDTILQAGLIDERTGGEVDKSLDTLARQELGYPDWFEEMKPFIKQMYNCPQDKLCEYLSYDIEAGAELCSHYKVLLKNENLDTYYETITRPSIVTLNKMSYRGIRLDVAYLQGLEKEYEVSIQQLKEELRNLTSNINFNPASNAEVALFIYKELGLPDVSRKGSVDANSIIELQKEHGSPFLIKLLEFRQYAKFLSTYIVGLQKICGPDGRIHTEFKLDGAVTGRLSSVNPNLQNIPSRHGPLIKLAFLPEEGHYILDSDYKQLELVVGAHMSQDLVLIDYINSNRDLHKEMASLIFQLPIEQISKDQRFVAKSGNFGVMYRMDEKAAFYNLKAEVPNMTRSLAKKIVEMPRDKFKELYLFSLELQRLALTKRYSETLFGRKRRYPLITNDNRETILNQATNAPIQGTASDICLLAAGRIDRELPEVKNHILIHDSLVCSIPKTFDPKEVTERLEQVTFETNVKFRVDHKVSERWGDDSTTT